MAFEPFDSLSNNRKSNLQIALSRLDTMAKLRKCYQTEARAVLVKHGLDQDPLVLDELIKFASIYSDAHVKAMDCMYRGVKDWRKMEEIDNRFLSKFFSDSNFVEDSSKRVGENFSERVSVAFRKLSTRTFYNDMPTFEEFDDDELWWSY